MASFAANCTETWHFKPSGMRKHGGLWSYRQKCIGVSIWQVMSCARNSRVRGFGESEWVRHVFRCIISQLLGTASMYICKLCLRLELVHTSFFPGDTFAIREFPIRREVAGKNSTVNKPLKHCIVESRLHNFFGLKLTLFRSQLAAPLIHVKVDWSLL